MLRKSKGCVLLLASLLVFVLPGYGSAEIIPVVANTSNFWNSYGLAATVSTAVTFDTDLELYSYEYVIDNEGFRDFAGDLTTIDRIIFPILVPLEALIGVDGASISVYPEESDLIYEGDPSVTLINFFFDPGIAPGNSSDPFGFAAIYGPAYVPSLMVDDVEIRGADGFAIGKIISDFLIPCSDPNTPVPEPGTLLLLGSGLLLVAGLQYKNRKRVI